MFNAIDEVKRSYIYAVQPVNMFETRNSQAAQKNSFDFLNQMNKSGFNPFHPNVSNSDKGRNLDLLS
ncbi:hypothetical protein HDR58_07155 [bacterium]|nr:hypothetical protein [bacterium]